MPGKDTWQARGQVTGHVCVRACACVYVRVCLCVCVCVCLCVCGTENMTRQDGMCTLRRQGRVYLQLSEPCTLSSITVKNQGSTLFCFTFGGWLSFVSRGRVHQMFCAAAGTAFISIVAIPEGGEEHRTVVPPTQLMSLVLSLLPPPPSRSFARCPLPHTRLPTLLTHSRIHP